MRNILVPPEGPKPGCNGTAALRRGPFVPDPSPIHIRSKRSDTATSAALPTRDLPTLPSLTGGRAARGTRGSAAGVPKLSAPLTRAAQGNRGQAARSPQRPAAGVMN